jgi:hypothetical protein
MEPERKIEKWLRAYAKKRRSQTGDSFKIHPAARRFLQSEISRNAPSPREDDETIPLWQAIRQMWAFLLGFGICVFLVAAIFFQSLNEKEKKAELASTIGNLSQIGAAVQLAANDHGGRLPATLDSLTNGYLDKKALSDARVDKPFGYLGAGKNLRMLSSNTVLAYSPEINGKRAILFADGRTAFLDHKEFVTRTNQLPSQIALGITSGPLIAAAPTAPESPPAPAPSVSPATETPAANMPALAVNGADRQVQASDGEQMKTFGALDQSENATRTFFQNAVASSPAVPVLANFQVQQNGNAIRVVDQDGSVYSGALLSSADNGVGGSLSANRKEADNVMATRSAEGSTSTNTVVALPLALPNSSQTAQNYSFQVKGFNRTLKQNVEFTGNLLANLAVTQDVERNFGLAANTAAGADHLRIRMKAEATNQFGSLPWSSLRIFGTATINRTNLIEINAAPVVPINN